MSGTYHGRRKYNRWKPENWNGERNFYSVKRRKVLAKKKVFDWRVLFYCGREMLIMSNRSMLHEFKKKLRCSSIECGKIECRVIEIELV